MVLDPSQDKLWPLVKASAFCCSSRWESLEHPGSLCSMEWSPGLKERLGRLQKGPSTLSDLIVQAHYPLLLLSIDQLFIQAKLQGGDFTAVQGNKEDVGTPGFSKGAQDCSLGTSGQNIKLPEFQLCLGYQATGFRSIPPSPAHLAERVTGDIHLGGQAAWGGRQFQRSTCSEALPLLGWPFKPQTMMSPQTARAGRGTAGLRVDCISQ